MDKKLLNQLTNEHKDLLNAITETEFKHLKNRKVLIIDDSKESLTLMKTYLGKVSNLEVRSYSDEFDALRRISHDDPDLLILDIMLSYTDGMKMGSLLKELELYRGKILFISSDKNFKHELKTYFGNDPVNFVTKPIDKKAFVDKVIKLLAA